MARELPLNAASVKSAKAIGGRPTEYRIADVPGLALMVQPTGVATYFYVYANGGTRRRLKLGRRDTLSLADARLAAIDAAGDVGRKNDPVADARARRSEMTFVQLVEAYMDAADGASASTKALYFAAIKRDVLKPLGDTPVVEINGDALADVFDEIEARGAVVQADRTRAAVSAIITWGIRSRRAKGLRQNVCAVLPTRAKSTPRSRGISDDEIKALWHALGAKRERYSKHDAAEPVALIVRLTWITGCRRTEVAGARIAELDLKAKRWTIPGNSSLRGRIVRGRTKSGQPKIVPLSTEAINLIERAMEIAGPDTEYLFPAGQGATKVPHIDPHSVSRAIARVRNNANAADVHLHDGRAACRTWLKDRGYPENVLDAALGHAGRSVGARHYEAPSLDFVEKQMRPAMEAWSNHVARVVGLVLDDS